MASDLAEKMVEDFEQGVLNRRQLASRLMGLGAVMAAGNSIATSGAAAGEDGSESTFAGQGLDHVALDVSDVGRSRDFYVEHLGLEVVRQGKNYCFLGRNNKFFLALFQREPAGLNHYCYAIRSYDPDQAARKLEAAGLKPRRENGRVYFDDPDGIEVQITGH